VFRQHAPELLGRTEVAATDLTTAGAQPPGLVEDVTPRHCRLPACRRLLQQLIEENVSIRDHAYAF